MQDAFAPDLLPNAANFVPLSPVSLIARTARVFPEKTAVVHGDLRRSWGEVFERSRRLASGLLARGLQRGDVVAVLAPNIPAFLELHFALPMAGLVLNSINMRLDPATVAFTLRHGGAKSLFVDREFAPLATDALARLERRPLVVDIDDHLAPAGAPTGEVTDTALIAAGDPAFPVRGPDDEWESLSLSYTSGTTGDPKGVVYSHRGAYLNAISNALDWQLPDFPVYLWTLPMFHCNGWCFPWTIAMKAGVNVCLRRVDAGTIIDAFERDGVTHLCGAPIVMSMIVDGAAQRGFQAERPIRMMTAAAPPPAAVIGRLESVGVEVTHVYGLTEVYGPCVVSAWKPEWDALPLAERAALKARQGVTYTLQDGMIVVDPATMQPVPADGRTLGEIMLRGNITMKGYYRNPTATAAAFEHDWFHSGDLAVVHPDGYVQIRDRSKDIIISGGENISSIEVEDALYQHPAVKGVAVVAKPDATWGETPCAFVELAEGAVATEAELIAWCRERLARYKAPRAIVFAPLPKTSTGKVQKFVLRQQAQRLAIAETAPELAEAARE